MWFADYNKNWEILSKREHSLKEIQDLIFQRSKRALRIKRSPSHATDYALFTLGYQEDVGFFILANQYIPEGTNLFYYGGEFEPNTAELKFSSLEDQAYFLKIEVKDRRIGTLQAREYGDFGSLLSHLPNAQQGFIQEEQCQTQNCEYLFQNNDVIFRSTKPILPGEVIGYDYSLYYWDNCGTNPVYFSKNKLVPAPLSQISQSPLISFFDAATGMHLQSEGENAYLMLSPSALFIKLESFFLQELFRQVNGRNSDVQLADFEHEKIRAMVNVSALFELVQKGQSLPPLTFFGVHTKKQGCMPPPHSTIGNGKTEIHATQGVAHDDPLAYRFGL